MWFFICLSHVFCSHPWVLLGNTRPREKEIFIRSVFCGGEKPLKGLRVLIYPVSKTLKMYDLYTLTRSSEGFQMDSACAIKSVSSTWLLQNALMSQQSRDHVSNLLLPQLSCFLFPTSIYFPRRIGCHNGRLNFKRKTRPGLHISLI